MPPNATGPGRRNDEGLRASHSPGLTKVMSAKRRILGWYFFDWASQPYHTVLLTFVFGPFFAAIATAYFAGTGMDEQAADARAQSLWSLCLTVSGLIVGFMQRDLAPWVDMIEASVPFWWVRTFSGGMMVAGLLCLLYNMWMTTRSDELYVEESHFVPVEAN